MDTMRYPDVMTPDDLRREGEAETRCKIDALIAAMTPGEKYSLLGGGREPEDKGKIGNAGYVPGIPRLGIPELTMYDGPAGITGIADTTGFPSPSLLGCTWDDELACAFGEAAAAECAACSGNVLLAPQVDVIRSAHFYRNKDMKSEDAYQAGRMGAAETRGVQAGGVIATLKHFTAANLFGWDLHRFPKQYVDEQTLHEVYCRPFEMALRDGGAGAVMNAYNDVNGAFVSANPALLKDILREQWQFKGALMSDWGSVHEFTLDKGVDMEMPYPAFNAGPRIEKRMAQGKISMETVNTAVRHVLYAMASAGLLGLVRLDDKGKPMAAPGRTRPIQMQWRYEQAVRNGLLDENAATAARIVREGTVLLKNDRNALPLKPVQEKTVLIGLGARFPICGEAQERSFGRLDRMLSGQEALEECAGTSFPAYAGIDYAGEPIPASACFQDAEGLRPGIVRTWGIREQDRDMTVNTTVHTGGGAAFEGEEFEDEDGEKINTGLHSYNAKEESRQAEHPAGSFCRVDESISFICGHDESGRLVKNYRNGTDGNALGNEESYTWKGYLKAPEDGEYSLILQCIGGQASFFIQTESGWQMPGQSQMREWTQWPWEMIINTLEGMGITSRRITLKAGRLYPILVHARHCVRNKDLQLRLAWETPSIRKKNREDALQAASSADHIVFFACDTHSGAKASLKRLEDKNLKLSDEQTSLLMDVIRAKRRDAKLTVVLQTANARAIGDWEPFADAIVAAYMPGQEGSRVLAELLTGKANFSGKLSQSWPRCPEDTPLSDTPEHEAERNIGQEQDGTTVIRMTEGLFTGYRWHDMAGVPALFSFGHGLSYTSFVYSGLRIRNETVRFSVTNTGDRAGDEIVQLYVGAAKVPSHIRMPEKQLAGYARVNDLCPGETREVTLQVAPELLYYWDEKAPLTEKPDGTKDKWIRTAGERAVYIGASSADIRLTGMINVKEI